MTFSIITINRNNSSGLEATISSVLAQTCCDYEYIIVDGASTDASVDVITRMIDGRENVRWISEPDAGIYNAMNKGVAMSTGSYLLFLNSGDKLANLHVLSEIEQLIAGDAMLIGRVNIVKNGEFVSTSKLLSDRDLSLFNMYIYGVPHQAAFIKRELLVKSPYDESLQINSDWKFFMQQIVLDGVAVKTIPNIISDYDGEGLSSTNMDLLLQERCRVFTELLPARIADDYLAVIPYYYEVYRVKWLLKHKFLYKVYRMWTSLGMRLCR